MEKPDLKSKILKGYLREFYCKPDMSPSLWATAKACLDNQKTHFYAVKFNSDESMKQFALAVLLSSGKQFNWLLATSYSVLQDNLSGERLLTDYADLELLFIIHAQGTMKNAIMSQSINQVALQRAPLKTFFFDRGGYPLELISPVVTVSNLTSCASKSPTFSNGDNL